MILRRRELLVGGSLAALSAACAERQDRIANGAPAAPPSQGPLAPAAPLPPHDPLVDAALSRALDSAKRAGASYADARVVRRRWEGVTTREDHVIDVDYDERYGLGVRVLVAGAWGFAATSRVDGVAAEEIANRAVASAKANARVNERRVELAPAPVVTDAWRSPMERDPFDVPIEEKAAWLLALWADASKVGGVKFGRAWVFSLGEWKVFASSEGSRIEQSIARVWPSFTATAVDKETGEFESVNSLVAPRQAGWEYVVNSSLTKDARRIAEDAVHKLRAPSVTPGKRDVILDPTNLWLTIHESIGHPTELDRALGYESNFAGTSYATPDKLGKLKIGSPLVTIYADKTTPGALATCAYDDDGVRTQKWDLVKDGVFVGYQTTREQAKWIGEKKSRGTCYAEDHKAFPFQRMPNVSLVPNEKEISIDDVISATDDGIYAVGNGSWSIDHQRYNFQFGSQTAFEVKNGRITGPVRGFAYQSNSIDFWNACDMTGGRRTWWLGGALSDGKGEPGQLNAVSHGCPVARFKGINVLDTTKRNSKVKG
jgi:TldD protein